jgi:hypothetical protein
VRIVRQYCPGIHLEGVISVSEVATTLGRVEVKRDFGTSPMMMEPYGPLRAPDINVFAAMPFAEEYEDVFFVAMAYAAEQAHAVVRRTDQEPFEGDVVGRIHTLIEQSTAVIADLSEAKPNVMYEIGYAHALRRPTVAICSTPLEDLPFDVRNWNVLPYKKGKTHELRERLAKRLKASVDQQRGAA